MIKKISFLIGLTCLVVVAVSCTQQQISREDLLTTLDSLETKMEWIEYQTARQYWQYYATGEADSLTHYEEMYNQLAADQELLSKLQNGRTLLGDEENQRRLDLILASLLWANVETDVDIMQMRDSLTEIDRTFKPKFEGVERSRSFLSRTYRYDSNRLRRESAFRAYASVGDRIDEGLEQLFRMRNQRARRLGYNDFLTLMFKVTGLDLDQYRKLLRQLDTLTEKPYLDIIDRIGAKLNLDDVEYWDVAYGYADINAAVDVYFPAESQLDLVKLSFKEMGMNLDKLPIYFDLDEREGKTHMTFSLPIKPPHDVRVMASLTNGLYSTRLLMHELGHAVHFASVVQDRELFARNISGAWAEGMAQFTMSLAYEPDWLARYPGLPQPLIKSFLAASKEQEIIYHRWRLMILNFELEAYTNPNRDLNKVYWDLFEKYMHLPRHEDVKPWAAIMHLTSIPVYLQNYLYADIIAAQTMHFIRENYGDPIANPKVASFLTQNYLRFGGRYQWQDLLERGTDEKLNPQYFIDQLGI